MERKYILTYDLGTASIKTALFDLNLNMLYQAIEKYPMYYPKPGWAEQDAEDWWNSVIKTTRTIIQGNDLDPSEVAALSFDCQGNCTVPVDREGNPLMRAINWLDTRASIITHKFTKGIIKISGYGLRTLLMFLKITGGAPGINGKDPISHILWIKEKEPEIYSKTYKFLSCKDYVIYKCTNKAVISRDLANTAWLMDSNPDKFNWSEKILNKFKIDKEKLPEIKKSTELAGELTKNAAEQLSLKPGIPVIVGSFDGTAAAIGSGAILDNQIHICLGTADWIATHISERKKDLMHYTGSICSAMDNYLCLSKQETGATCLDWIKNQMFREEVDKYKENPKELYKYLDSIVENIEPGAKNLLFTPWMYGERSPINDPNLRGGFYNLSLDHERADLLRALYEGIAFNIKWGLKFVEKLVGTTESINFIGGGAKSDIWCQILADVLERNINQMDESDFGSVRGATIIAMVGLDIFKDFGEAIKLIKVKNSYKPNIDNKKIYDKLFSEYIKIYKRNKKMFKNLNV